MSFYTSLFTSCFCVLPLLPMKELREKNHYQVLNAKIAIELIVLAVLVALKTYLFDRGTMRRFVSDYRNIMHSIPDFDSILRCTNLITIDEEQDRMLRNSEL